MQINENNQTKPRKALLTLGLAGVVLSTGCAPYHGGGAGKPVEPVAQAPVVQPLPEQRNESRYGKPVAETEVVQVYGYPVVREFESRSL